MTIIERLLEDLVESVMAEVLRGFNLNQFKSLPGQQQRIEYAQGILPLMGEGSSRIVFALSGGKVLKIALNNAGKSQNKAEMDVATDPATKPIVTRVYDVGDDLGWVIAEIAKPLDAISDWEAATGLNYHVFSTSLSEWEDEGKPDFDQYIKNHITIWQEKLKKLAIADQQQTQIYKITQRRLKNYLRLAKSPMVRGVIGLLHQGLNSGDLIQKLTASGGTGSIGHYGKTVDGRIVVIDYGFNDEVYNQFYSGQRDLNRPVV